ncbi:MAG: hypothetical protein D6714_05610 [Bacteroidetes bacterium]|nr:MAG: hypothetical protein D6714_05610 [Bacteroidota bacterium]
MKIALSHPKDPLLPLTQCRHAQHFPTRRATQIGHLRYSFKTRTMKPRQCRRRRNTREIKPQNRPPRPFFVIRQDIRPALCAMDIIGFMLHEIFFLPKDTS